MSKYKLHINLALEMIELVQKSLKGLEFEDYVSDSLLRDATNMRIQVISENVLKLPDKYLKEIESVSLSDLRITRNIISHSYTSINERIVWHAIMKKLPSLKKELLALKKKFVK